jgi:hypothetical protein
MSSAETSCRQIVRNDLSGLICRSTKKPCRAQQGQTAKRIKDLVGAFAQVPKLPKMLRRGEIIETLVEGDRRQRGERGCTSGLTRTKYFLALDSAGFGQGRGVGGTWWGELP